MKELEIVETKVNSTIDAVERILAYNDIPDENYQTLIEIESLLDDIKDMINDLK